jgi:hypothetical protein
MAVVSRSLPAFTPHQLWLGAGVHDATRLFTLCTTLTHPDGRGRGGHEVSATVQ